MVMSLASAMAATFVAEASRRRIRQPLHSLRLGYPMAGFALRDSTVRMELKLRFRALMELSAMSLAWQLHLDAANARLAENAKREIPPLGSVAAVTIALERTL